VGTSHVDWVTFTTAVRNIPPTNLRTAMEDEQRLQRLESRQQSAVPESPTASIRQAFNRTHLTSPSPSPMRTLQHFTPTTTQSPPQPTTGGIARNRLYASFTNPNTTPIPPAPARPHITPTRNLIPQSAYRAPRVRLVDLQRHSLPHEPDTVDGRARYVEQIRIWHEKHGPYPQAKPDEYRPYPLTLGTQSVNTGACFNCGGKHGDKKHYQRDCPVKDQPGSVPMAERAFRAIAAICYGLIAGPQPLPTPVNFVDARSQFVDVTHEDDSYIQALINSGAFISEVSEEEKASGSSA